MLTIYRLRSENLTGLGAPMGMERTWDNWTKSFTDLDKAKKYAEKDYAKQCGGKPEEQIKWTRSGGTVRTQDLRFVMYHIKREKVS